MQAHTVVFDGGLGSQHVRMAKVLKRSAEVHGLPLVVHDITAPDDDVRRVARASCKTTYIDNARKAKHHNRIIQEANDGDVLCLLDADTMIVGDVTDVERMDFDLAYTVRPPKCQWKINTGVYFVRVSEASKAFVRDWYAAVLNMLADEHLHNKWKSIRRYGGTHQAAFGWMLETSATELKLLPLDCETYNVVNGCYETATDPRIVHLMKHSLREWCFARAQCRVGRAEPWIAKWREYDGMVATT